MSRPRIVLAGERPRWVRWLAVTLVVVVAVIIGWAAFTFLARDLSERFEAASGDRTRLLEARRDLSTQLRDEKATVAELREQLAYLEKSQMIDREACQRLRDALRELQAQLVDTQEQLAFYRGIVAPEDARGVRVHDLVVYEEEEARRFELVLMQAGDGANRARGRVELHIEGTNDGETASEVARDLDGETEMLFSFRHFQEFSGEIRLPEGFEPQRARVMVHVDGEDAPLEVHYDWQRLVAG